MPGEPCPDGEKLSAFVLGILPEADLERVARHLDACPACEAAAQALDQLSDPVLVGLRRPPASGSGATDASGRAGAVERPVPERLGDYRILRELGRGGMGVVYEAEQVSLGRRVALKVLPRLALLDRDAVARFRRESRAAARLHHTNIVPVFGTGEQDGLHYFVMQLIPGSGLDRVIQELRRLRERPDATEREPAPRGRTDGERDSLATSVQGLLTGRFTSPSAEGSGSDPGSSPAPETPIARPPSGDGSDRQGRDYWRGVARLGIQVANALAFAHAQGVVHRDVKPSNLLLDPGGRLWVTDFGLAKEGDGPEDLTRSGLLIGTLRYVPPERFHGPCDARGDVYGLGLVLYELLALRPAFPETDRSKLLQQAMHAEPPRPSRLNPAVPRDLETVVLKATARDPARRYQTAAELADDLARFVADRPIRARRVTPAERLWRACRRDPVRAALVGALLLASLAGVIGVSTQWWRAEAKARSQAEARAEAERAEGEARRNLYFSQIAQARLEWRLNNVAGAEELLDQCEPGLRGWEWGVLRAANHADLLSLPETDFDLVLGVAFSPDGRFLACGGWSPFSAPKERLTDAVKVWDLEGGRYAPAATGFASGARVDFSPDGRLIAAGGPGGAVRVWRPATGEEVASWVAGGTPAFGPDGRLLVTGGTKEVCFWEPTTGRLVRKFPSAGGRATFSPDGKHFAVSGPEAVELREVATGREVRRFPHGPGEAGVRARRYQGQEGPELAFSPDGRFVATATRPPRIWDALDGRLLHPLVGHAGNVTGVAFAPDGRSVATAGDDGTVRLWDVATGAELRVWRGHRGPVGHVAFHPDGWCLASGGRQPGEVKLWDLTRDPEFVNLPELASQALAFEAGGDRLRAVGIRGDLQTCDLGTGHTLRQIRIDLTPEWLTPAFLAAFSGDGRTLAAVAADRHVVKVCDAETGREAKALTGMSASALSVAVNEDGSRVAAAGLHVVGGVLVREVRVWDAAKGRTLSTFRPAVGPTRQVHGTVALSPDGSRVAFDDYSDGEARVRVADASGRELLELPLAWAVIRQVTFSADGKLLAAVDAKGELAVWDAAIGRPLYERHLHGPSYRLAFSPDGKRLAAADRDQVKVWDVGAGRELLTLRGAPPRSSDGGFNPVLAWSPDGRRLGVANWDGSASIWDASGREAGPLALRRVAEGRAYHWHLGEAEAATAAGQGAAALFHLERVLRGEPPDGPSRLGRARLLLRRGDWSKAAADYAAAFDQYEPDEDKVWLAYARALLLGGDAAGYRRLCARLLARPTEGRLRSWSLHTARACALAPGGAEDPVGLVRIAEAALAVTPDNHETLFTLGLAHYRAGQWEQAVARLKESAAAEPTRAWRTWPMLAVALRRLSQEDESRRRLADAAARHAEFASGRAGPAGGLSLPPDWPEFEALYAEARNLLNPGSPPPSASK